MQGQQFIVTPFGVTVFGSAIVRVVPDVAVLSFSVSRVSEHPKEAFQAVRDAARKVQTFLNTAQIKDAGSSQINLHPEHRYENGVTKFVGYRARIDFRVVLSDLTRVEEILVGIVDAGVNEIGSVSFQTTRLKELRAEARHQAVVAAHEKAKHYCLAAGVGLGEVIHIEDINPDQLQGREGHSRLETPLEDAGGTQAFDPSSIIVGGAVIVAFAIHGR